MALPPGTKLGPYEILAPIGAGGMGEVYRARDLRLDREIAVKVLPEHLSKDPQSLARFEREAKAIAALSHPNIVALHDVGNDQGIAYAVTELLEGENLRGRLRRGAIPWEKAIEIGAALADGLSAAHLKGIVHRDLKPENIFLTSDERVKVLDFGLARWRPPQTPPDATSALTETDSGTIMGTVGYMSPEQVRGRAVGPPSDLFSLGCVLYEMVAGRRAFARETPAQTMTDILERRPAPLVEAGQSIPRELERLISRCLEKNADQRSQSARDLSSALKDLLSSGREFQPARPRQLSRKSAIFGAVLGLALLFTAAFYWLSRGSNPTGSIAVLPFVNAGGNPEMEYLSDGITESLINALSQVPNIAVMSRNSVFRYKGRETDAQAAGRTLNVQAVLTGTVAQRGDSLSISTELIDVRNNRHLWGEQYNRKLQDILAVQEEISTEISEKLRLRLSGEERKRLTKQYTENSEAYRLSLQGRYYWNKRTPAGFEKGIEYFQKAIQIDPNFAPAYTALVNLYFTMANYGFALMAPKDAWRKASAAADKALAIDSSLAAAHAARAFVAYQWEWDWPKAEKEFKRALELDGGSSSTYEPSPSATYHWYSHFLMSMGRTAESLSAGRRALELDPVDAAINAHQGWYYLWTHQPERAIEPLKKAIEEEPNFWASQVYLGLAYEQQGVFPGAIAQFQNTVRLTGGRLSMLALLGHAYSAANRKSEAQAILRQLREGSKEKYVPSYAVAVIYLALGDRDEALTRLENAYDERDAWMVYLAIDPRWDTARLEPRFRGLIQRMNLAR